MASDKLGFAFSALKAAAPYLPSGDEEISYPWGQFPEDDGPLTKVLWRAIHDLERLTNHTTAITPVMLGCQPTD